MWIYHSFINIYRVLGFSYLWEKHFMPKMQYVTFIIDWILLYIYNLFFIQRSSSKIEEACEMYTKAANMFKMAKKWSGEYYLYYFCKIYLKLFVVGTVLLWFSFPQLYWSHFSVENEIFFFNLSHKLNMVRFHITVYILNSANMINIYLHQNCDKLSHSLLFFGSSSTN